MQRWYLSPGWVARHVAVTLVVVVCVNLGFWQLRRLDHKRALNARIASAAKLPQVSVEWAGSQSFRRVRAEGIYDPAREILLSRSSEGRPGYHVLTPLRLASGQAVLVDRGWVPFGVEGPPVRGAEPPPGTVAIEGYLVPNQPHGRFGGNDPPSELRRAVRLDVTRFAPQIPYPVLAMAVLLAEQRPAGGRLPVPQPLPPLDEGPHRGYALQWFAFAGVAAVGYVVLLARTGSGKRREWGVS